MENDKMELEAIATAFRRSIYNAYSNTLISGPKIITNAFNRMKDPQVGDWVIETSTIHMTRRETRRTWSSDLDGVGILEEITWEKVRFSDPEFVWNEEEEGRPHPTERIYYIRTLDGRRFRWENASIIAAQTGI